MDATPPVPSAAVHDETLIEWFLSLTPAQRLAELESRLAFFDAARGYVGSKKLRPDPRDP
jgi:hypothetical protein